MPHELRFCKREFRDLKKQLYNFGFQDGYKGIDIQSSNQNYFLSYEKGQKTREFEDSELKLKTIDDKF